MDKRQALGIAKKYAALVKEKMPFEKIVLFGSYAKGNFRKDSDIDIAVIVNNLDSDFFDTSAMLWTLCRQVDVNIEPILLDSSHDPSGFLENILKYGKVIS